MFTKQLEGLLTFNPDTLKYWVGVHRLTSWGEGTSLALIGHPSSDGIMIKIFWDRCFTASTSLTLHLFLLGWLKLNLTLLLHRVVINAGCAEFARKRAIF